MIHAVHLNCKNSVLSLKTLNNPNKGMVKFNRYKYLAKNNNKQKLLKRGTTLPEVLIGVVIVVVFLMSMFELNGLILRTVNASKENIAALEGVHDRLEVLRNQTFATLKNSGALVALLTSPANGADFSKTKPTEVVTISAYPSPNASNLVLTRAPGSASVPTVTTLDANIGSATIVRINVTWNWTASLGARAISAQAETIISDGIKR